MTGFDIKIGVYRAFMTGFDMKMGVYRAFMTGFDMKIGVGGHTYALLIHDI